MCVFLVAWGSIKYKKKNDNVKVNTLHLIKLGIMYLQTNFMQGIKYIRIANYS